MAEDIYRPSGRMDLRASALFGFVALALASGLGFAHSQIEWLVEMPAILLTPLMMTPLFAALYLFVRLGRCRSPLTATLVACACVASYYVAFFAGGYHRDVGSSFGQSYLQNWMGSSDPLTYLHARLLVSPMAPRPWVVFTAVSAIAEYVFVLTIALSVVNRTCRRVFFEETGKWSQRVSITFHRTHLPTVRDILASGEWHRLNEFERRSSEAFNRRLGLLGFMVEYDPSLATDLPVYASIEGAWLNRLPWLLAVMPFLGRFTRNFTPKRRVPAPSSIELLRIVGGETLFSAELSNAAPEPSTSLSYSSLPEDQKTLAERMLGTLDIRTQTRVNRERDFRTPAANETTRLIASDAPPASQVQWREGDGLRDLRRHSLTAMAWTVGGLLINFAGVLFMIFGQALLLTFRIWIPTVVYPIVGVLSVTLFVAMVLADPLIARMLIRRRLERSGSMVTPRFSSSDSQYAVIVEDASTFHISKAVAEDFGICTVLTASQTLIIDGLICRYQIDGRNVRELTIAKSPSSVAIRVGFEVGTSTCVLVLTRPGGFGALVAGVSMLPLVGLIARPWREHTIRKWLNRTAAGLGKPLTP